jgi:ribonuclease HII
LSLSCALANFDDGYRKGAIRYIVGVDEAGRGALAGPMYAGAVLFAATTRLDGLNDSKRLSPRQRERLAEQIQKQALAYGIATVSHREIDERGLDWANRIVLTRAVRALAARSAECTRENTLVLVDGVRPPYRCPFPHVLVKGGDRSSLAVAAASILAKTARDRYCVEVLEREYPGYGFAEHKGYGTRAHYEALDRLGPSSCHRLSYRLVRSS